MSNWDDEDFQPAIPAVNLPKIADKWDGEDEEEEVKESWEDFTAEEKAPEASGDAAAQEASRAAADKKKKKKLADIVAEKERKKQEEKARKLKAGEAAEPEEDRPLTEAERIALAEERELEIAKETFGVEKEPSELGSWDVPLKTEEDLKSFREALVSKFEKRTAASAHYVAFLEDLLRDLCVSLDTDDVKKLSATVNAIHNEKVNAAKAGGKAKKGKKGAKLNVGSKNAAQEDAFYGTGYDDYDDFI